MADPRADAQDANRQDGESERRLIEDAKRDPSRFAALYDGMEGKAANNISAMYPSTTCPTLKPMVISPIDGMNMIR